MCSETASPLEIADVLANSSIEAVCVSSDHNA